MAQITVASTKNPTTISILYNKYTEDLLDSILGVRDSI